jgi:hypothetical protein
VLSRAIAFKPFTSTIATATVKTTGQILQRPSQRDEHDHDQPGENKLRKLATGPGVVGHGRLGRTAIDDEGPRKRGAGIGRREAENVGILVHTFLVPQGINPGSRGALRDDHDETRCSNGEQRQRLGPGHIGPTKGRQAARHGTDGRDAMAREIECGACRDHPDDDHQRHGEMRRQTPSEQNGRDDDGRKHEGEEIETWQSAHDIPELGQSAMRLDRYSEHVGKHGDPDLNADANEEADQRRSREKIGEKTEFEHSRQQQQQGGQQGEHADQSHIFFTCRGRHVRQGAGKDRGRGGICRHNEMA